MLLCSWFLVHITLSAAGVSYHTISNIKTNKNKINIDLETYVDIDKKDNDSDLKILIDNQKVKGDVKFMLNEGEDTNLEWDRKGINIFTNFIKEVFVILHSYNDNDLKSFSFIFDEEIRKFQYRNCKVVELAENDIINNFVRNNLRTLKQDSVDEMRSDMAIMAKYIDKYDNGENKIPVLDLINSLYTQDDVVNIRNFLNDIEMYRINHKKNVDLRQIIQDGIRSIIFDKYSKLQKSARKKLKQEIEESLQNYLKYSTSLLAEISNSMFLDFRLSTEKRNKHHVVRTNSNNYDDNLRLRHSVMKDKNKHVVNNKRKLTKVYPKIKHDEKLSHKNPEFQFDEMSRPELDTFITTNKLRDYRQRITRSHKKNSEHPILRLAKSDGKEISVLEAKKKSKKHQKGTDFQLDETSTPQIVTFTVAKKFTNNRQTNTRSHERKSKHSISRIARSDENKHLELETKQKSKLTKEKKKPEFQLDETYTPDIVTFTTTKKLDNHRQVNTRSHKRNSKHLMLRKATTDHKQISELETKKKLKIQQKTPQFQSDETSSTDTFTTKTKHSHYRERYTRSPIRKSKHSISKMGTSEENSELKTKKRSKIHQKTSEFQLDEIPTKPIVPYTKKLSNYRQRNTRSHERKSKHSILKVATTEEKKYAKLETNKKSKIHKKNSEFQINEIFKPDLVPFTTTKRLSHYTHNHTRSYKREPKYPNLAIIDQKEISELETNRKSKMLNINPEFQLDDTFTQDLVRFTTNTLDDYKQRNTRGRKRKPKHSILRIVTADEKKDSRSEPMKASKISQRNPEFELHETSTPNTFTTTNEFSNDRQRYKKGQKINFKHSILRIATSDEKNHLSSETEKASKINQKIPEFQSNERSEPDIVSFTTTKKLSDYSQRNTRSHIRNFKYQILRKATDSEKRPQSKPEFNFNDISSPGLISFRTTNKRNNYKQMNTLSHKRVPKHSILRIKTAELKDTSESENKKESNMLFGISNSGVNNYRQRKTKSHKSKPKQSISTSEEDKHSEIETKRESKTHTVSFKNTQTSPERIRTRKGHKSNKVSSQIDFKELVTWKPFSSRKTTHFKTLHYAAHSKGTSQNKIEVPTSHVDVSKIKSSGILLGNGKIWIKDSKEDDPSSSLKTMIISKYPTFQIDLQTAPIVKNWYGDPNNVKFEKENPVEFYKANIERSYDITSNNIIRHHQFSTKTRHKNNHFIQRTTGTMKTVVDYPKMSKEKRVMSYKRPIDQTDNKNNNKISHFHQTTADSPVRFKNFKINHEISNELHYIHFEKTKYLSSKGSYTKPRNNEEDVAHLRLNIEDYMKQMNITSNKPKERLKKHLRIGPKSNKVHIKFRRYNENSFIRGSTDYTTEVSHFIRGSKITTTTEKPKTLETKKARSITKAVNYKHDYPSTQTDFLDYNDLKQNTEKLFFNQNYNVHEISRKNKTDEIINEKSNEMSTIANELNSNSTVAYVTETHDVSVQDNISSIVPIKNSNTNNTSLRKGGQNNNLKKKPRNGNIFFQKNKGNVHNYVKEALRTEQSNEYRTKNIDTQINYTSIINFSRKDIDLGKYQKVEFHKLKILNEDKTRHPYTHPTIEPKSIIQITNSNISYEINNEQTKTTFASHKNKDTFFKQDVTQTYERTTPKTKDNMFADNLDKGTETTLGTKSITNPETKDYNSSAVEKDKHQNQSSNDLHSKEIVNLPYETEHEFSLIAPIITVTPSKIFNNETHLKSINETLIKSSNETQLKSTNETDLKSTTQLKKHEKESKNRRKYIGTVETFSPSKEMIASEDFDKMDTISRKQDVADMWSVLSERKVRRKLKLDRNTTTTKILDQGNDLESQSPMNEPKHVVVDPNVNSFEPDLNRIRTFVPAPPPIPNYQLENFDLY